MQFKTTGAVVAVFAALAAYLFWVDDPRQEQQQLAEQRSRLVFPEFDPEQVTSLRLANRHGEAAVTRSDAGDWQVSAPWADRANQGRIRSLLADLGDLRSEREVAPADADLEAFDLAQPEVTLRLEGQPVVVTVGGLNPAGDARYLRAGAGPVLLATEQALSGFQLQLDDLRSQDVIDGFPWDELHGLAVQPAQGDSLRLEKGEDTWQLLEPIRSEADPDAVQRLGDKLRWARINTFLNDDPTRVEAELSTGVAVTLTAAAATRTVRLARVGEAVWADCSGRDARFTVPVDVLEVFEVAATELQRRKPVLLKAWKVEQVELTREGKTRRYAKVDGTWQRDGVDLEEAEQRALQELLDTLENTAADEVISRPGAAASYGFERAAVTLALRDSDGREHHLLLGTRQGQTFARDAVAAAVYRMPTAYRTTIEPLFSAPMVPPTE